MITEYYPPEEKMLRIVIWYLFFGNFSQSETLSEIKPPLKDPVIQECRLRPKEQEGTDLGADTEGIITEEQAKTSLPGFLKAPR